MAFSFFFWGGGEHKIAPYLIRVARTVARTRRAIVSYAQVPGMVEVITGLVESRVDRGRGGAAALLRREVGEHGG